MTSQTGGLWDTACGWMHGVAGHLITRLELLRLEVQMEQQRLMALVAVAMLAWMFVAVSIALVVLALVASFWDTAWRLHAIGWALAASVLVAALAAWRVMTQLRKPSVLFERSLALLREDQALLRPQEPAGKCSGGPVS